MDNEIKAMLARGVTKETDERFVELGVEVTWHPKIVDPTACFKSQDRLESEERRHTYVQEHKVSRMGEDDKWHLITEEDDECGVLGVGLQVNGVPMGYVYMYYFLGKLICGYSCNTGGSEDKQPDIETAKKKLLDTVYPDIKAIKFGKSEDNHGSNC